MASVALRGLSKSYGKTKAIQDLNLVVEDGEFFVLLGPSGAGKTTTLALIAGLEIPDTGEIFLGDDSLAGVAPWHRDVAMAFESYALYPHLTVFDNIAFPLRSPVRLPRLHESEIKERVQRIAAMLQIDHLLDRRPSQLSGGQRQRTSLGRMLVRQPRAFLMDEPIVHLDAKLRHHMRGELKQLHQQFPTTTLYATPDWIEAVAMGHRIAVLQRGHVVQVGTPDEIFHRPVNRFVADFVGEPPMNILNGRLVRADDNIRFDIGGAAIPLGRVLGQTLDGAAGETEWQLGVRPSAIRLDMANGAAGSIPAAVFVSEPLGRDTVIETRLESQSIAVKAPGLITLEPGTQVWLTIDPADIHMFDKRSGLALRRDAAPVGAPIPATERFIG
jgi:multiple sugar transport system ATP-binding protein